MSQTKKLIALPHSAKIDDVRQGLNALIGSLASSRILVGVLLEGVVFEAGVSRRVAHKLGRLRKGYIVAASNASTTLYSDTAPPVVADPTSEEWLISSAAATLNIWYF